MNPPVCAVRGCMAGGYAGRMKERPEPTPRPDYGIDAPDVVRRFLMVGTVAVVVQFAAPVLVTMLVATVGYVLAGTLIEPTLWFDPLGPLTKIVPVVLATLLLLAMIEER